MTINCFSQVKQLYEEWEKKCKNYKSLYRKGFQRK